MELSKIDYLVTGALGFLGLNFVKMLSEKYPDACIGAIDMVTSEANDAELLVHIPNVIYFPINIRNAHNIFKQYKIDSIIHYAAESHVDRSITSPRPFIESNILGTFELLELTRLYQPNARFHHVSTDEVYGSTNAEPFTENSTYKPSSVYSASKAASDMLVMSYIKTYGLKASISNCCNNYGIYQNGEKLIPRYINYLKNKKPFPLFNRGMNIREWIHVDDHNNAILNILESNFYEKFNIGSSEEFRNIDLLWLIHSQAVASGKNVEVDFEKTLDMSINDRLGHDMRYAIDSSYCQKKIGYKLEHTLSSSVLNLIEYYWYKG